MLKEELKRATLEAARNRDEVARDVLRLAQGEIQLAETREGSVSEERAADILRKLVKANEQTLAALPEGDARGPVLRREIELLGKLLPATLAPEAIVPLLAPVQETIRAAKNDGQATGIAVKHLKSLGVEAPGAAVQTAVKLVRT